MSFPSDFALQNSGGQIGGQTEKQIQVLLEIQANPRISRGLLAEKLNINESTIQKHLINLTEKGYLERIGGTRGS